MDLAKWLPVWQLTFAAKCKQPCKQPARTCSDALGRLGTEAREIVADSDDIGRCRTSRGVMTRKGSQVHHLYGPPSSTFVRVDLSRRLPVAMLECARRAMVSAPVEPMQQAVACMSAARGGRNLVGPRPAASRSGSVRHIRRVPVTSGLELRSFTTMVDADRIVRRGAEGCLIPR